MEREQLVSRWVGFGAVSQRCLHVGGERNRLVRCRHLPTADGVQVNGIAKWNGNIWSALGLGVNGFGREVRTLAINGNDLYAAGTFSTAGEVSVNNVAKWNGSAWSALDIGLNPGVRALAVNGTNLYAGG